MKILIATPLFPPDVGGPATYAKQLFDGLPSHGVGVTILSFGGVWHLLPGIRHVVYFVQLIRASRGVDCIYALDPWSVGVPSMCAAVLMRKTFLVKIVGDYAWEQGVQRFGVTDGLDVFSKPARAQPDCEQRSGRRAGGRPGKEYHPLVRLFKFLERMVALRARKVVVPSEYLKGIVSNWGVPKNRIVVIPNASHEIVVSGRKNVLRGMLKARGEIIISAGRLVPWKGFDGLIEAMPQLMKRFPKLKLLIAGDGPDMERLEALAAKLNMGEHVIFLGKLTQDVLFSYIKLSDIFVLNTSYEGFSHQLLEAMAIGVPIITTNVGGNPELITHRQNGLLIKHDDARGLQRSIAELLHNKTLRDQFVRAGRRSVGTFSEKRMLEKTATFLAHVV